MRMQTRWKPSRLIAIALLGVALIASGVAYGADLNVDVQGCVIDFGGKPYRGVDVELRGVGSAGYSYDARTTNLNGEFSVTMKAGEPPPGQPTQAQLRAEIKRPFPYVVNGWFGSASDVAQVINVTNTGSPIDLRQQGCIRYPSPISVGGVITSAELDEKADKDVMVLLRAGGTDTRFAVGMPWRRGGTLNPTSFNFLIALSEGDVFSASVPEQPKGATCFVTVGEGIAGQNPTEERGQNYWVTTSIRIHCVKAEFEPEKPRPRLTGSKPLLTVGGAESSSEELSAFHQKWDAMEQALYEVGETMPDWETSKLQTVAGRAVYFRLCDERLSLAQKRKNNQAERPKREGEMGTEQQSGNRADLPVDALPRRGSNSGTALFQNAIDQAVQDEKDRPAREARERAAKLRTVEQERQASKQAADNARALEDEQAQKIEQDASELRDAVGNLINAIGQSRAKRASPASAAKPTVPFCTPGSSYDAKRCACYLQPNEQGCAK